MNQLDLFGGTAAAQFPALTERQQVALDAITVADGGLPSDEIGAVLHEWRGSHDRGTRCSFCTSEGRQLAVRLKQLGRVVQRRGGMWQAVRPLDTEGPSAGGGPSVSSGGARDHGARPAAARLSDPPTSHEAAASIRDLNGKQQAVLDTFRRCGPMTDEQLCERYPSPHVPVQSESGLRTRRHELVEQGHLRNSGRKDTTESGRASIVWELSDGIPF